MKINEIIRKMSFLQLEHLKSEKFSQNAKKTPVKNILNLVD